jgi:uncharacterized protein YabE (DUF348 family)
MTTPLSPTWRRRARIAVSFPLLGLAAAATYGFSTPVAVTVDGEVRDLRTYAATVGDVIEQLDVEVGPADEIRPHEGTELESGMEIDVARAITVDVHVDGSQAFRVTAPVSSVAGVLAEAGLDDTHARGARVEPAVTMPVDDGDVVRVSLPTPVTVEADGRERVLRTFAEDVEAALDAAGVTVGPDDLVEPAEGAIVGPTTITVQRVEHTEEVEEVTLDHDEVRRETDDLERGTTRVDTEGRDGVREDTYRVTVVEGEETERELVEREVVREPRDRVVLVGTYEPPPPEPEPEPTPPASSGSNSSGSSSSGSSSSSSSGSSSSSSGSSSSSSSSGSSSSSSSDGSSGGSGSSSSSSSSSSGSSDGVWDRLAQCESGGNWSINTGNGYYGGLQFALGTWRSLGGTGYPHEHSRAEQIAMGKKLQARSGWGQWPHCSRALGLR